MARFIQGNYFQFLHWYTVFISILELSLSDISCDFNEGKMCEGWIFEHNTTLCAANWTIWTGATPTLGTGPSGDHLYKEGYYIYMETTNKKPSDIAIFYTPDLYSANKSVNTTFWYHMHGIFIQSLKLYVRSLGRGHEPVMTISDEQGDHWKFCNVYFEEDGPFKLEFQAMVGSIFSDIAVDDIKIIGAEKYLPKNDATVNNTNYATTITPNIVPMKEDDSNITLPYIIVCTIGGILWFIILIVLCCCIQRAHKLDGAKRTVGCNTTNTVLLDDENNDDVENSLYRDLLESRNAISLQSIELMLDAKRLTDNKSYCAGDGFEIKF